jgi:hypothetical protein
MKTANHIMVQDMGDLKKKRKRIYQELYREDVGTEKELEQKRKEKNMLQIPK